MKGRAVYPGLFCAGTLIAMQVYISYAHADQIVALEIHKRLTRAGIKTWIDARNLFPGDNWPLLAGKALEKSDAMVAILSPASLSSEWFRGELQYALGSERFQRSLFPVVLGSVTPSDLPWVVRDLAWLRAPSDDPAAVADQIAQALKALPATEAALAHASS